MKKLFYISLIALCFGVSSCNEELDITPSFELNEVTGITNAVKARAAVDGVYPFIVQGENFSGGLYAALASKGGYVRFSSGDYDMTTTQTNNSPSQQYYWLGYYETINAANFAINGISKLTEATISEEEKTALLAEARFLKAFAQMFTFWKFGHWWESNDESPYGVLYRDELSTVTNLQKGRLSVGESYARIFEDIDFAIENLPSFSEKGNRYVSKEFAKVFKAKVLLYRHGFNDGRNKPELVEALGLVNEILDASIPGFSMQADLEQVYEESWDSPENLFSGYLEQDGARSDYDASNYARGYVLYGTAQFAWTDPANNTAGLRNGTDAWFKEDPRWLIATGPVGWPYAGTSTYIYWAWKKVSRLGQRDGKVATPPDNKYNTYFFRYPELYILKAELLARTGASYTDAIAPINEMRSKRTNPVFESLDPQNEQEAMDMIFKEYFLETFLENGSEFFSSLRFKTTEGDLWMESLKDMTIEFNKICYPIPSEEMLVNKVIEQNPDLE